MFFQNRDNMKHCWLLITLIVLFFFTCQDTTKPSQVKAVLPNTPTEVAQEWIEAFYNDDFKKAILLGTLTTQMMIDSVKKEMEPDAMMIAFKISNMTCETKQDSAFCTYIYSEEYEKYEEYINLLKVDDQWLVNESWDASSSAEQEFDMMREEREQLLLEESVEQKK